MLMYIFKSILFSTIISKWYALLNYLVRFLEIDSPQQENIDKILNLLDEIRDPFAGQATPAMIGLEYLGSLQTI